MSKIDWDFAMAKVKKLEEQNAALRATNAELLEQNAAMHTEIERLQKICKDTDYDIGLLCETVKLPGRVQATLTAIQMELYEARRERNRAAIAKAEGHA